MAVVPTPASDVAVWTKVASTSIPEGRYLQAVAFDETQKVLAMFGGMVGKPPATPSIELWLWPQVNGEWTKLEVAEGPVARSGAAMVFDSKRGKFLLFGGRAADGSNLDDTWELDAAKAAWTKLLPASQPSARSQHAMVYEKSTGKILLFGGGQSDPNSTDGSGMTASLGDTWEYAPAAQTWQRLSATPTPSSRHDSAMAWDASRNKVVLFGGMHKENAAALPQQDLWEWDPAALAWSERATTGTWPSQRYGHALAFDGSRNQLVLFGGWDSDYVTANNDLWDWDPASGTWTRRLNGTETGIASPRIYASLVADDAHGRLELVAGAALSNSGPTGLRELWEIDPAKPAFTDRIEPIDFPLPRRNHAMAYNPSTGKTYVFGGSNPYTGEILADLWAWDGQTWARLLADQGPSARVESAMAYDPAREALILYGGRSSFTSDPLSLSDTWEWTDAKQWTQLQPPTSPDARASRNMVTDTTRNKILLLPSDFPSDCQGTLMGSRNDVWEWDGSAMTWTRRMLAVHPSDLFMPWMVVYDKGRQRLWAKESWSGSEFWEWDPFSAGWSRQGDLMEMENTNQVAVAYDSLRRRLVALMENSSGPGGVFMQTWELDATGPTWYMQNPSTHPAYTLSGTMAFDSGRGVMVFFGGIDSNYVASNDTWEYRVSNLANGEGCTSTTAAACASGNCVDGVCCEVAACAGKCLACNVPGSAGTCAPAKAGAEVPGSCADNLACDGSGACKSKNGRNCTAAGECASGFCADGICCDSACAGTCTACNLAGQEGKCQPYPVGTDPQKECGVGTGVCKSTCDGIGACGFPGDAVVCATCTTCDGKGACTNVRDMCRSNGGMCGTSTGGAGGTAGSGGKAGTGGSTASPGGTGGRVFTGGAGGSTGRGGAGGTLTMVGSAGGSIPGRDGGVPGTGGGMLGYDGGLRGSGGSIFGTGGSTTGSGGTKTGTGGSAAGGGGTGRQDAGTAIGGGGGNRDAAADTTQGKSHRSGCSCELETKPSSTPAMTLILAVTSGLLRLRRRWRTGSAK
jgi:hypothetical protein